jgi:hypothetical protein
MSSISNVGMVVVGFDSSGSVTGGGKISGAEDKDDEGDVAMLD